jgi:hypothetical protein
VNIDALGKALIAIGILIATVGIIMIIGSKFGIGRLPGDIYIQRGNFSFYFPLATSIIISIVLSIIFSIFKKL